MLENYRSSDTEIRVEPRNRFVFVCGLHRSGTSLIAKSLAQHPLASGFSGTGEIEDEGQFLQTVLPLEIEFGGVGRFGFDARAHMTEGSHINNPANASRLFEEWSRHWDISKPLLIEKTPSNLLRMRLLNRLLSPSFFIVVTRHPVAAALATMKWTEGNLFGLLYHWVHCYRIARADAAQLENVLWVSYESLVADPVKTLSRIARFLDLRASEGWPSSLENANRKYFTQWQTDYHGDWNRTIAQLPPEMPRSIIRRVKDRITRDRLERSLPAYRQAHRRKGFRDAQDAASLLESEIATFGYSFYDLTKSPVW